MNPRSGFSLVELVIALAIVVIAGMIGTPYLLTSLPTYRANGAARHLMGDFRLARTLSVERGVDVLVQFDSPAPNQYTMACDTFPPPAGDHNITAQDDAIKVVDLPALYSGVEITRYGAGAGLNPNGDPLPADGISFQAQTAVFNPDGRARAGSVYLRPARDAGVTRKTERCVTVTGSTGRAKAYRWTGTQWE